MIRFLLAILLFVTCAQAQAPTSPIISSTVVDATSVLNVHENGQLSLASINIESGEIVTSFTIAPQELRTAWKDEHGVEHVVVTPMPSDFPTLQQIEHAIALHDRLVKLMQQKYPPKK